MSVVPSDFEDAVASAAGVRNAADAALVDLVACALAEGWWEGWRVHTPVQWSMWKAGVARSTASAMVRLARRAPELPTTFPRLSGRDGCGDHAAMAARWRDS